jgi:hypothetical protein
MEREDQISSSFEQTEETKSAVAAFNEAISKIVGDDVKTWGDLVRLIQARPKIDPFSPEETAKLVKMIRETHDSLQEQLGIGFEYIDQVIGWAEMLQYDTGDGTGCRDAVAKTAESVAAMIKFFVDLIDDGPIIGSKEMLKDW